MAALPTWFAWKRLRRLFVAQAVTACLLTSLFGLLVDWQAGYSALLGALISVLPGVLFAYQVLAKFEIKPAHQVARSFYFSELIKLLFTVALFVMVLLIFAVKPMPLFVAYVVTQLSFSLALIWLRPQQKI